MKVEITEESSVVKRLEVEVEPEVVEEELSRAYRNLAGRVRIKGFRQGKVPIRVLKKQFGSRVKSEVTEKLLRVSFSQAIDENKIPYVGNPTFEEISLVPGSPFTYQVKVEVKPEITIETIQLEEIEKEKPALPEDAVKKELEALQRKHSQIKSRAEDAKSQKGDLLTIDFLGKIDGVPFEGGVGKDSSLELGSKTFIPGFEEQLAGVTRGPIEISVKFPEDYNHNELAGKDATFEVVVKDIQERITPDLDDEFAKDIGDFEDLKQLKEKIEDELMLKRRDECEAKLKENLLKAAIEKNPFEVPPSLVERQIDHMISSTYRRFGAQGLDFKKLGLDMDSLREDLRERSQFQVSASLLIDAIAKKENIAISEADLSAHFEKLAQASEEPVAKIAAYFRAPERLEPLKFQLLEEKVLDLLTSKATIIEVESPTETEPSDK